MSDAESEGTRRARPPEHAAPEPYRPIACSFHDELEAAATAQSTHS